MAIDFKKLSKELLDYIDSVTDEELLEDLIKCGLRLNEEDANSGFWGYGTLKVILDQQPTVDAEPVIRCEKCYSRDGEENA